MAEETKNRRTEDFDIVQLFQLIGNGLFALYRGLVSLLNGLFRLLIELLLFVRRWVVYIGVAAVLGGILGYLLNKSLPEKYVSRMVVEPNFNSTQQLYNNIEFYNDLARSNDSITLASLLNISQEKAASLRNLYIDSYSDENQKIKLFDEFVRNLDTTTIKSIDFKNYIKNFNSLDARFHRITVISIDNSVAREIQEALIEAISDNVYFKLQKRVNDDNLILQDTIYRNQLREIDSLQHLYQQVLLKEADKPMQGTSISMGESAEYGSKELELIQEKDILKQRLVELNKERANKSEIVNVISDFPVRAVKLKGLANNYLLLVPVLLISLVMGIAAVWELNAWLSEYSRNRKKTAV